MRASIVLSSLVATGLLLLVLATLPARDAAGADAERAETTLKALRERARMPGADVERLRQELVQLRITYPGAPAALEAAKLLAQLPSPLDRLEHKEVPELERFEWQPEELVAVLGEHRGRHGGHVQRVVYSADGSTVISGGTGLVRIWDANTLRLRSVIPYDGAVLALALTADGRLLAVGGSSGVVQVWDVTDKSKPAVRYAITTGTAPVNALACDPDGKLLAAGSGNGELHIHDIAGKMAKKVTTFKAHQGLILSLAYSPDGKVLASGGKDKVAHLWDADGGEGKSNATLEGKGGSVSSLAFSPKGDALATGFDDSNVFLWTIPHVGKAKPRHSILTKAQAINGMVFSSTGNTLVLACYDGTVRIWSVAGAKPAERSRAEGHGGPVFAVALSPDDRTLISGGFDWTVRSWDVSAGKPRERYPLWSHFGSVHALAFSPDEKTIVSGSEDQTIRAWDVTRSPLRSRTAFKGTTRPVYALAFSPDGKALAVGDTSTTLRQWDAATGRELAACRGNPGPVSSIAYHPDGKRLLAAAGKALVLWDAAAATELRRFKAHQTSINCMALSPDGRRALSGSGASTNPTGKPVYSDCVMRLWDVDEGTELASVMAHKTPVSSLAFSADGSQAYSGELSPAVRHWGLGEARPVEQTGLKGEGGFVNRMMASADGRSLVTFGMDGKLIVWDLATGMRVKAWELPEFVDAVALSPSGRFVAVGLGIGVVYVLRIAEPGAPAER